MGLELGEGLKPRAEVRNVVVASADPHGNGFKIVSALRVSDAAKQLHDTRATAGLPVDGVTDRAVVATKSDDLVAERRPMLLASMCESHQLFELHVVLVDHPWRPPAPVQCAIMDISPADVAGGVPLEGDDRKLLILQPDARPPWVVLQLRGPPTSVGFDVVSEGNRAVTSAQCLLQRGVHTVEVGAPATKDAGREGELANRGLEVLGAKLVRCQELAGEAEELLLAGVADLDRAVLAVQLIANVLEDGGGALGLLRAAAQAEPGEDGDRGRDVLLALRVGVRRAEQVIDVHAGLDAEGGQELHDLAAQRTGERRGQLEAQRQPGVTPVRPPAVGLVSLALELAPLIRRGS